MKKKTGNPLHHSSRRIEKWQCYHCSERFRVHRQLNAHSVMHRNTAMSAKPRRVAIAMSSMTEETKKITGFLRELPLISEYDYPVKSYGPKETKWEKRMRYLIKKPKNGDI